VKVTAAELHKSFLAFLAPAVTLLTIAAIGLIKMESWEFTTESSFQGSGGFGPNQVSAVLGLATFIALFYALHEVRPVLSLALAALALAFATQSAMTFSRGGLYGAGMALICACVFLLRDSKRRAKVVSTVPVAVFLAAAVILPKLDTLTSGALTKRFQDVRLSNREEIIAADIRLWLDNPIYGAGPGMGKFERQTSFGRAAAHTEYSRLLAEHGIFGLLALLLLLIMHLPRALGSRPAEEKALIWSMCAWAGVFMATNGMRLAAPALAYGLASLTLVAVANTQRVGAVAGRVALAKRRPMRIPVRPVVARNRAT
jgi:hypothetical protein